MVTCLLDFWLKALGRLGGWFIPHHSTSYCVVGRWVCCGAEGQMAGVTAVK